jgi:hypothetical protein
MVRMSWAAIRLGRHGEASRRWNSAREYLGSCGGRAWVMRVATHGDRLTVRCPVSLVLPRNLGLEAPPGFEPGVEVLQGHPRSFLRDGSFELSRPKSHSLNRLRRSLVRAHRGCRWLKLGAVGSRRAQFGHSSTSAMIEFDHSAVIPYCALGEHSGTHHNSPPRTACSRSARIATTSSACARVQPNSPLIARKPALAQCSGITISRSPNPLRSYHRNYATLRNREDFEKPRC